MKYNTLVYLALIAFHFASNAHATDLKACEDKIAELLAPYEQTLTKTTVNGYVRETNYKLNAEKTCGVEFIQNKGFLTITDFSTAKPNKKPKNTATFNAESTEYAVGKFETITLNQNDPTYTENRVQAIVTCDATEDNGDVQLTYTAKIPVYADGVRSQFKTVKLSMNKTGAALKLKMSAVGVIFKSTIECELNPWSGSYWPKTDGKIKDRWQIAPTQN